MSDKKDEKLVLRGEFAIVPDVPTQSGRIYPKDVWEKAILDYKRRVVDTGRALGVIDEPERASSSILLAEASHIIRDMTVTEDGHTLVDIEVLNTPKGKDLKWLLQVDEKHCVGCYSGGVGSVDGDGNVREFRMTHTTLVPPHPGDEGKALKVVGASPILSGPYSDDPGTDE